MHGTLRIATLVVLTTTAGAWAVSVPVTTCGQTVATRSAELVQDLDCSGYSGDTVSMPNGGRLVLNGFTLTLNPSSNGLVCNRACRVTGPGTVTGGNIALFLLANSGRIHVDGVTVTGARVGVSGPRVLVRNSTLTGNTNGIAGGLTLYKVVVKDSVVTGSGERGVQGFRVRILNSDVTGSGGACPPMGALCCDLIAQLSLTVAGASTCGTSCRSDSGGGTWGLCTSD